MLGSAPLLCLLEPIFPLPLSLSSFSIYSYLLPTTICHCSLSDSSQSVESAISLSLAPFLHLGHKCLSGDDILRITGNGNWKRRTDAQAMSVALDSMRVFNLFCLRKWPRFETRSPLSPSLYLSVTGDKSILFPRQCNLSKTRKWRKGAHHPQFGWV